MNKIERVIGALRGEPVDRPPFSFWYHFGLQHMSGKEHAAAEIDFYRSYDLDFLKVMSDFPYPLPKGLDAVATEEDWKRIEPVPADDECWHQQLLALSLINEQIGKEAMFIETIFSTWTTARRLSRSGGLAAARERFPETLQSALNAISNSLADYAKEVIKRGAAGIFLSLGAATDDVMSAEDYQTWGRPFDLRILDAIRNASFNVLHIHGKRIHFNAVMDYPVAALNWSHFATTPSLSSGKTLSGKTVLGGIDESTASHVSAPEIGEQVDAAIREIGVQGLIVTPGCSIPTDTREQTLREVKAAVERSRS